MLLRFRPKALFVALALALAVPCPGVGGCRPVGSVWHQCGAGQGRLRSADAEHATDGHRRSPCPQHGRKGFLRTPGQKRQAAFPPGSSAQGYTLSLAAENIAAGQKTPEKAVQAWLDSPGHRKNVLNCKFRETGIAMVYQPDDKPLKGQSMGLRFYWVQVFGVQR